MKKNMDPETNSSECCSDWCKDKMMFKYHRCHGHGGGGSNAIYCLGVIGAGYYFLQNVHGFMPVVMGIGKSIVWPALLMFKLLTYLKM